MGATNDNLTLRSNVELTDAGVVQTFDMLGEISQRFVAASSAQFDAALHKRLIELGWTPPPPNRALREAQHAPEGGEWIDGAPTGFRASEWFIARLKDGTRAVLRALPEEYTYDFKSADETYYKQDWVVKWMPFPDSAFLPPEAATPQQAPHSATTESVEIGSKSVAPPTDGDMARALDWVRALAAPCSAEEREALSAIEEAIAAYDPERVGAVTVKREAVVKIHRDGYWTHEPGHDPFDRFGPNANRASIDCYTSPATGQQAVTDEMVERGAAAIWNICNQKVVGFFACSEYSRAAITAAIQSAKAGEAGSA